MTKNTRLSTPAQLQFRVPERGSLGTRLSRYEVRSHLPDTHVELDTDDEEISLFLAGGHQQLVGVVQCMDLLPNH